MPKFSLSDFKKVILYFTLLIIVIPLSVTTVANGFFCNDESSSQCQIYKSISTGCFPTLGISAKAEYKSINANSCTMFKKYESDLDATASKYNTQTMKLNKYIMAGLIDRETRWGAAAGYLGTSGCDIIGDNGYGYGLAQMDKRAHPELGTNPQPNAKANLSTKKFGQEQFSWTSCKDSIQFIGAKLLATEDSFLEKYKAKLKESGINNKVGENGFEDSKASNGYLQYLILSYNGGATGALNNCSINKEGYVNESCTTGGNYSTDILTRAKEFFQCLNNREAKDNEVVTATPISATALKGRECMDKIQRANGVFAVSNSDLAVEVKKFVANTSSITPAPSPVPGEQQFDGQCVSLVKQYVVFLGSDGKTVGPWAADGPVLKAAQFKSNSPDAYKGFPVTSNYKPIPIYDYNQIESGDIILQTSTIAAVGHTGILLSKDGDNYKMYNQNPGAPKTNTYNKSVFLMAIRYVKKII